MMRRHRAGGRLVGGLLLAGVLAGGCGGNPTGSGGGYYMRFQTPGGQVNFTAQGSLLAAFGQAGNQRTMLATGFDATRSLSITVYDGATITEKKYDGYGINQGLGAFVGVLLTYQDANGTIYNSGSVSSDQSVTITSLTATTVTGTFEGTLKATGHADLRVSSGQFFVLRGN